MRDANPIRTLGDYSKPSHEGYMNTIELPVGNNVVPLRSDTIRRTIDQSAGGKLRDRNAKESWALLEDLALYDNESWNDLRDFAKPVKAISLPQDVPSTSDRCLIELENQVQCLMEAHLALTQPTQVNKITTSCEIYSGPHNTQYCMEDPKRAFFDYASSRTDGRGRRQFTTNQGPRNFNEAANSWKGKPNFNWVHAQTFTSPWNSSFSIYSSSYQTKLEKALIYFDAHQEKILSSLRTQLEQQQDDMISKINLLWKAVSKKLDDAPIRDTAKYRASQINFTNPSSPKRVHFINSIIILNKEDEAKEEGNVKTSKIEYEDHEMTVESEEEFEEETKGEIEEEEEDSPKQFDTFPTMKELRLYLTRRSLEVLRKFHWIILGGRFNQLLHVSSLLLSKPVEY
ncbi:hypothetical protein Tco_0128271 [Tanacetum coccineum]